MKVCLICLFFLTLQDGDAETTRRGMEGGNITVGCNFSFSGTKMYFCKEKCEGENILIETEGYRAQRGRYSIEFVKKGFASYIIYVSITDLKRSDSGRYRCGLVSVVHRYDDFHLDVTEAPNTLEPNWTLETFTTTAATLTQRLNSSSSTTIQQFTTSPELKGPPAKMDPTDFTTINTVYEEIREDDRENKPPAGEIASVYACVQSNQPIAAESNGLYSLAGKPQGEPKEEDIEYSEVQLPTVAARSNSGHLAASDNITYSEPRLAVTSGSHGNGSPSLYSTIALQK